MEYVWFVVTGLAFGLVAGRFLQGNNFGVLGDVLFSVGGALAFGIGLVASGVVPGAGMGSKVVMASVGALLALVLRRVLKTV